MDSYSEIVTRVADELIPQVASVRVRHRRGDGTGSAVMFTDDGYLLTNRHVVGRAKAGTAEFSDGTQSEFDVVGDPLPDLAVLRVCSEAPSSARAGDADALRVG